LGDLRRLAVPAGARYRGREYNIEPDASAASYFFAAAAITGGEITVQGLSRDSLQGDVSFVDVLARMGCDVRWAGDSVTVVGRPLTGVAVDMNAISDTGADARRGSPVRQRTDDDYRRGPYPSAETDRLAALAAERCSWGEVDERADGLRIARPARRGDRHLR
jgi:3-phosphoshikimate 1-carboxyvinyltransferase